MEYNFPKLDLKKYLKLLSLNFTLERDEQLYSQMTNHHKKAFLKFMIVWILFMFVNISCLQYGVYSKARFTELIFCFVFLIIAFLLYIIMVKVKNGFVIEIFLALIISGLNIVIIEFSVPLLFVKFMTDKSNSDLTNVTIIWMSIFIGIHLKTLNSIMTSAKINWLIVSIANLLTNTLVLRKFIITYKINSVGGVILTMILPSFILPVFIAYIDEKKIKELFIHLIRAKENLTGFEELIENIIPCHIIILNTDKKEVLYCNSRAKNLFEVVDDNQILLQKLNQIKFEDRNLNFYELSQFCIDEKKISITEAINGDNEAYNCSFTNDRNQIYFFDVNCNFVHWRNLKVILIVLNDVSYKMQCLNEISQYKDMILASISHNLRTPLNSISGFLELAADKTQHSHCSEYIATAQSSCKSLLSLINNILDFSQLSSNTLRLNFKEFFVYNSINEILDLTTIQIKRKNLKFLCNFCDEIKKIKIRADLNRFQQILMNLIENAIKYTFQGQIVLTISLENCLYHNNDHDVVVFKINDTGIGIEEDKLNEIFKLYPKIDNSNSENRECLGFSLSISQHLAKAMHEEGITVTSKLNKGSEFRFSLPYNLSNEELINEESSFISSLQENSTHNPVRFKEHAIFGFQSFFTKQSTKIEMNEGLDIIHKINVLLVDDDALNNLIHEKYIENLGFECEVALNGKEALEKIEHNANIFKYFSIVLLDCNMPVLNGFETAKQIRFLIEKKAIPYLAIIAITANVTIGDIDHCQKSGMEYYLSKPVSRNQMLEKIAEVLENMRQNRKIF